jgi:hypothetical protein
MMRFIIALLWCSVSFHAATQTLHLTSVQHELRWLDEGAFPPLVNDKTVRDSVLHTAAQTLSSKFGATGFTVPNQIDYRLINMFGKPKFKTPEGKGEETDYQAAVLSFITRATTGYDVLWSLKVDVKQKGKTVFSKEVTHQLLNYEASGAWFDEESFVSSFKKLLEETLELSPPMAYKFVLGSGLDYAELLKQNSEPWGVSKKSNPLGFGMPSFGPYSTTLAEKMDSAVLRTKTKIGKETSIGLSDNLNVGAGNSPLAFNQYKIVDFSKTKFGELRLANSSDTTRAVFAVGILQREARKTVLGHLFGNQDESSSSTLAYNRDIAGTITTDTLDWDFNINGYDQSGIFRSGYLALGQEEYLLEYKQGTGFKREAILKTGSGEYVANLDFSFSDTILRIRKKLDPMTEQAIAAFYAVLLSVKNVQ